MRSSISAAAFLGVVLSGCGFDSPSLEAGGTTLGISTSKLTQVNSFGSNPGNLTMFEYVPAKVAARNVPVIVAMHGCTQSASAYVMAGWNTLADSIGAIIVYPQTAANGNCFSWFDPANARRGVGRSAGRFPRRRPSLRTAKRSAARRQYGNGRWSMQASAGVSDGAAPARQVKYTNPQTTRRH